MMKDMTAFKTLEYKPDYEETVRRYEAFWNGEIIDRPIVQVTAPNPNTVGAPYINNYYARIHDDLDALVQGVLNNTKRTLYLGEAIPSPFLSFGCDEVAAFCGGDLYFENNNHDTCWSKPIIDEWEKSLPIAVQKDNPLWQRMRQFITKCADALEGKSLFNALDLHTNMDLLLAMRGSERLCMDLVDCPELIDKAMEQTMEVFEEICDFAYRQYKLPGAGGITLQCDFSCMLGTPMFRRFALPYLEREAEYFGKRTFYHWDGVGALTHTDDLIASKGLYVLAFLPGEGHGPFRDYLELYEKIQKAGKAVLVGGSPDEVKYLHKRLRPDRTVYYTSAKSAAEAEALLEWFKDNT
jgi:hypothetical protein